MKEIFQFLKDVILSPKKTLTYMDNEKSKKNIFFTFLLALAIPFIKSFFTPIETNTAMTMNFSSNLLFRMWLTLVKYPIVTFLFHVSCYFIFILIVNMFMKITKGEIKFKTLFWGLASLSIIGILARIFMEVSDLINFTGIKIAIFYTFYLWITLYSIFLIKNIFAVTWAKSILAFIIAMLICFPLTGLLTIVPYLIWF